MTPNEVNAVLSHPESRWKLNRESPVEDNYITGYLIMRHQCAKDRLPEQILAKDGIVFGFKLDDLPRLSALHVKELGRLGWHLDAETGRFAYFTVAHERRIT